MSTWLLLLSLAAHGPAHGFGDAAESPRCLLDARSSVGNWALAVLPDGVQGSGVSLQRVDDLVRGFVFGYATRLRIKGNHISGILAGARVDLNLIMESHRLELRGQIPGVGRAVVVSTPGRFRLIGDNVTIDAIGDQNDDLHGDLKVGDRYGEIAIRGTHCQGSQIWRRPELVLALIVAPRASLGP